MQTKLTNNRAFSLIELLIVIAILGILAAVALPTYKEYVFRSKISTAIALSDSIVKKLINHYQNFGAFTNTMSLEVTSYNSIKHAGTATHATAILDKGNVYGVWGYLFSGTSYRLCFSVKDLNGMKRGDTPYTDPKGITMETALPAVSFFCRNFTVVDDIIEEQCGEYLREGVSGIPIKYMPRGCTCVEGQEASTCS